MIDSTHRVASLRTRLAFEQVDAAVISQPVNVAYLTGFDGVFDTEDAHVACVTGDETVLYTDSRYFEAASQASKGTGWDIRLVRQDLYVTVCDELVGRGVATIALEASVPYQRFRFVSERWGGHVVAWEGAVERIRQVKSAEEIRRIAAAQELTDRGFEHLLGLVRPGVTEREIGLELEVFLRREGSEGVAFPPIVASGPNSAHPHARVTDRCLERGEFVKLDFGAVVDGYCSDMTRTVAVGHADQRQREVYQAVLEANLAGISAVAVGATGKSVDGSARAVIAQHGLGDRFGHGLGHGVGLHVHELPNVGPRSDESLLEGCVITIEPGVYLPGWGGVRIEDLVVVERTGARVLTRSTKELIEV